MKEVLFKANDIRGLYPSEINEDLFHDIGLALPSILKSKKVAIGRDIRLSSNSLFSSLASGLIQQGVEVLDLGLCDTPYTYFISGSKKLPCLMITASHNPKNYNGLKIILPDCRTLTDKQVDILMKKIRSAKPGNKEGKIQRYDKRRDYAGFLIKQIDKKQLRHLKIVVDCSNGMAETIAPLVFAQTNANVHYINKEPNGNFPAHSPNPAIPDNLRQLQHAVLHQHADLGIMFDGDCDRVAFVDENGKIIDSSIVASIVAHYMLLKNSTKSIVHTMTASRIFPETISIYGGNAVAAKVGHRFMKDAMRQKKAIFGAEPSGHYYFKSNFYADSGMLAALLFYEIASIIRAPVSLIRKTFEKYHSLGEINFHVSDRDKAFSKVVKMIKSCKPDWQSNLDGYAALKKNHLGDVTYATIRKSNTENLIRLTVESTSKHCALEFEKGVEKILKKR